MLYILYAIWCSRLEENPCTQAGDLCLKSSPCATLCRPRCVHGFLLNIEQIWHIIDSKRDPEWVSFTIFLLKWLVLMISLGYICMQHLEAETKWPSFPRRHFPIYTLEWKWILNIVRPNLVPMGPINNSTALFQIMAWRGLGDKPLSEPTLVICWLYVILPKLICVTRPQWANAYNSLCARAYVNVRYVCICMFTYCFFLCIHEHLGSYCYGTVNFLRNPHSLNTPYLPIRASAKPLSESM